MVTKSQYQRLFPGKEHQQSKVEEPGLYDNYKILPLRPGVVQSVNKMAAKMLAEYELDKVKDYDLTMPTSIPEWDHGWYHWQAGCKVDNPLGKTMVLDCETFVKDGNYPIMACAITKHGTFLWKPRNRGDLMTVAPGTMVIAHSAAFEACRTLQSYTGEALFLDTRTMAKQCFGYATAQGWVRYVNKPVYPRWKYAGSGTSLSDIYERYYNEPLDKQARNIFVTATTIQEIEAVWEESFLYNIKDVVATIKVFDKLLQEYVNKSPNITSLYGMVQTCSFRLPLTRDWTDWVENVRDTYNRTVEQINQDLVQIARDWVKSGPDPSNPWKSQLDWTINPKARTMKGYPEWYRKCKGELTIQKKLSHWLLEMEYLGHPVQYADGKGFYSEGGKVPHPDGGNKNVGYLFSKDLQDLYERGDLSSKNPKAAQLMELAMQLSYWRSVQKRVDNQHIHNVNGIPVCSIDYGDGTFTGRCTDPLWLTTCDAKKNRIGSELKSRIQAPPGYKFLNADYSSQEYKIAALLSDSLAGKSGSTIMSLAMYQGDKAHYSDPHSRTATLITSIGQKFDSNFQFSRDAAKGINFALLYMAGVKTIADGVYKNSKLSSEESLQVAKETLVGIRGNTTYEYGIKHYSGGTNSESYTMIDNVANRDRPRTPVLHREMSDPVCPEIVGSDYYTSRANWVIQASARDMLDILLTSFHFMCHHFKVNARVIWTRHDEVIVLVPDSEVKAAAELLQMAHVYSWAAVYEELGLPDMPNRGLLFDGVEVDTVVRKSPTANCTSPSNPVQPPDGYTLTDFTGIDSWSGVL